ncbi:hypothetical protein BC941DRAFT_476015 [Chlamydoabsidia padenii]|nr:hypothetical protein BC941DRAFT_476015 [Chlamydoabsidia padenii]
MREIGNVKKEGLWVRLFQKVLQLAIVYGSCHQSYVAFVTPVWSILNVATGEITLVSSNVSTYLLWKKYGYSLRGRDANAAINIMKIGIYLGATKVVYPAFSTTTTVTTNALAQHLFDRVLPVLRTLMAPVL